MGNMQTIHADLLKHLRAHEWEAQNGYYPRFHAVMGDPPYFLGSIVRRFGKAGSAPAIGGDGSFGRLSKGFMGKAWDGFDSLEEYQYWVSVWGELMLSFVYPGAILAMSGGTRTYHRLANGLEDAGWEIFDSMLAWNYGSGFPKAADVGKKGAGAAWEGYKTALKPAYEPIILARAPRGAYTYAELALNFGTGALNVDGGRIESGGDYKDGGARYGASAMPQMGGHQTRNWVQERIERGEPVKVTKAHDEGRYPANLALVCACEGYSHEPGCPVRVMDEQSGDRRAGGNLTGKEPSAKTAGIYGGGFDREHQWSSYEDEGGASRFFYTAKSPKWEREAGLSEWFYGSEHIIIDAVYWDERSQLWVNVENQVMLQMDTDQSPPKVIAVYGIEDKNVTAWNTLLFGSKPMERCLPAMTCITEMRISSITNSPTLSYLANSITSDSILDVSSSMGNGSSHAESAGSSSPWISITSESMEYPHGAPRAALRMQLRISVNEKPTPGKVNDGRAVDADNAYQRGSTPRLATHPTMKPILLMQWLAALLLPPPLATPRRILVPFAGVASEMIGAHLAGWDEVIGIEREPEYIPINAARRAWWGQFSTYDDAKRYLGIEDATAPLQGQMTMFDYLGGDS